MSMTIPMDRMYPLAPRPVAIVSAPGTFPESQNGTSSMHKTPSPVRSPDDNIKSDTQTQMERSLQRTITLVIWYKPNCDPIRLNHEVTTFPLFQLSHFPALVSDLDLSPSSYIDTYNNVACHWEQHMITTVRSLETDQRLLYKIRKSLLNGIADEECHGLAEELASQATKKPRAIESTVSTSPPAFVTVATQDSLKRPATDPIEMPPNKRYFGPEGYISHPLYTMHNMSLMFPGQQMTFAQMAPPGPSHSGGELTAGISSATQYAAPSTLPNRISPNAQDQTVYSTDSESLAAQSVSTAPFPSQTHPPLKRWPNDYTVSEVAAGFREIDTIVSQTPTATQRQAFERVFGCRYVKSTVCRHRSVWRKAGADMRITYEAMGSDERAIWGEFVRRVEGRPPGKMGHDEEETMLHVLQSSASRPNVEHQEQPKESASEIPGSMPPPQITMEPAPSLTVPEATNGHISVYDPALGVGTAIPGA
ncbi:hypothetical protein BJ138DRAFT_1138846 [Hygrophoropsis aurantiaca]|uniref:Uncharacterized protein n=1 Tax=Hygrophoropsis aurantiaca TaxID=72124 RepID=A0ACB8ASR6_9AGAM|nr:hypothetical protein BJ138DRAFT_1138846 [Hygrophoropsis aurantiaca]